jgi:Right handed beta helix region
MNSGRTGRRRRLGLVVKGVAAAGLVVGIGVAPVLVAADPAGDAIPTAVLAASLPAQQAPEPEPDGDPVPDPGPQEPTPAAPQAAEAGAAGGGSSWEQRGRPSRMVTVRSTSLDVVVDGRVSRRAPFGGTHVTLAELDRALPADWLTITDGTATLAATVVLTRGTTLDITGAQARTLQLTGGASPADAASLHTGGGALTLTGLTVTSLDPATGQPVPATAAGRPSLVASTGGRLEATDTTITGLGTAPSALDEDGQAAVVFNPTSTGALTRTTVRHASTGLRLVRSHGVRLTDVTVADSAEDGLVLSGDRATVLGGIRADRNGGNGVLVTGEGADRAITGITTTGNGGYGVAVRGQAGARITAVATTADRAGGLDIARSSDVVVTDFAATDQRLGVHAHINSTGVTLDRVRTSGGRWGVAIEKTTHGLEVKDSTFQGAQVAGASIGGQQTTFNGVQVRDSETAVRIERGANDVQLTGLAVSGGRDGVVAKSDTTGVVVTGLVADNVASDAVRTASAGTRIVGGQITGGTTGIDAEAATTITDTVITNAEAGIRSNSPELVQATGVAIDTLDIGVNTAAASPFLLADSEVHALESVRGEVNYQGVNDLSLPPLNVISVIGLPLIVLAIVLEQIHAARQRRYNRGRRRPPVLHMGTT